MPTTDLAILSQHSLTQIITIIFHVINIKSRNDIFLYICLLIYIKLTTYLYMCMYICSYVCLYMYMYVYMCVCLFMYVYMCVYMFPVILQVTCRSGDDKCPMQYFMQF